MLPGYRLLKGEDHRQGYKSSIDNLLTQLLGVGGDGVMGPSVGSMSTLQLESGRSHRRDQMDLKRMPPDDGTAGHSAAGTRQCSC